MKKSNPTQAATQPADFLRFLLLRNAVKAAGTSFAELARKLNVSPTFVGYVARGQRRSKRVQTELAKIMGVSPRLIWRKR